MTISLKSLGTGASGSVAGQFSTSHSFSFKTVCAVGASLYTTFSLANTKDKDMLAMVGYRCPGGEPLFLQ